MSNNFNEKKLKKTLYNLIQITKFQLENKQYHNEIEKGEIQGRLQAYRIIYNNFFIYPDTDYINNIIDTL